MTEILPIRHKTLCNQSINQLILTNMFQLEKVDECSWFLTTFLTSLPLATQQFRTSAKKIHK